MSEGAIRAWRLSKARYAGDLTGQGAARDGQRWNQPGQRAVYLGMTPEITVLEVLVHLNGVLSAPLILCGYDVPDTAGLIAEADPTALPEGWNAIPHRQASAAFGGDWLRAGEQLGLLLPSVVVPQARNLLLNPLHPAMAQVALVHQEPFRLDARLG
ncbi:RES family NAD+ phosphorylase [Vulcanococcus limneticus]|uniref:RES family NAD+ phosphorylase n=1 Tax=Vulcanococcus limneticus TaxID=2170428 RepID=UPI00398BCDC8